MPHHVVRQGETLARIAERRRLTPEEIWDADENAALREARGSGHILRPGDVLFCPPSPDPLEVQVDVQTDNDFEATVPRVPLTLRLIHAGEAASGEAFVATAGAWRQEGMTNGEGAVEVEVPVTAQAVELEVPGPGIHLQVQVGSLDPAEDTAGIQDRLHALGFYGGPSHGQIDAATTEALSRYQHHRELPVTGRVDESTLDALREDFGC